MVMINCPKCDKEFDNHSKWGPKKFCSRICANSRLQTTEIRDKKRAKLSIKSFCKYCNEEFVSKNACSNHERYCENNPDRKNGTFFSKTHADEVKRRIGKNNRMGMKVPTSILDMSKRTSAKIMKRLNIGCFNCDWNLTSCDLHHIIPRSKGGDDSNSNLTWLCPNCHRLAHEGKLNTFVSLEEKIGEEWRKYYFAHE